MEIANSHCLAYHGLNAWSELLGLVRGHSRLGGDLGEISSVLELPMTWVLPNLPLVLSSSSQATVIDHQDRIELTDKAEVLSICAKSSDLLGALSPFSRQISVYEAPFWRLSSPLVTKLYSLSIPFFHYLIGYQQTGQIDALSEVSSLSAVKWLRELSLVPQISRVDRLLNRGKWRMWFDPEQCAIEVELAYSDAGRYYLSQSLYKFMAGESITADFGVRELGFLVPPGLEVDLEGLTS